MSEINKFIFLSQSEVEKIVKEKKYSLENNSTARSKVWYSWALIKDTSSSILILEFSICNQCKYIY